jgi:hypothetical protein
MASDLPADVVLSYNGQPWPNTVSTKVSGMPVYDSAGRVVTHVVYTLNASAIWSVANVPGNDVSDSSEDLRVILTKPGGTLVYTGAGNDFGINTTDADVKWGPKPKLLAFTPLGKQQAVKVDWQVEVAILECDPNSNRGLPLGSYREPLEFNYKLSFSIDQAGYTRRTYTGHVVIAQTRKSITDRTVSQHADALRERILPRVPRGYRRESQSFELSEDRNRLNFTVIDAQMPVTNYPPEGVVVVNASHTMSTENLSMIVWRGHIAADYEVAAGVPRSAALGHFVSLVEERLAEARAKVAALQGAGRDKSKPLAAIIPVSLTLAEPEVYGRRSASFNLTYRTTMPVEELEKAINWMGLFRRVGAGSGGNWDAWDESMHLNLVNGARGHSKMEYRAEDDKLIDGCITFPIKSGNPIPSENVQRVPEPPFSNDNMQRVPNPPQEKGGLLRNARGRGAALPFGGDYTPETSWLAYQNELIFESEDDVIECKLLPTRPVRQTRGTQRGFEESAGGYVVPYADAPGGIIQIRGKPAVAVVLQGYALRAGYDIAPPELVTFGGQIPVLANRAGVEYWRTGVVANMLTPVVGAYWRMRWLLPLLPTNHLTSPTNPIYGGTGGGENARTVAPEFARF